MGDRDALIRHLESGATTTCRAWQVTRRDGIILGFTDHDRDLVFDGVTFRANSGLTARMLQHNTGLAADNSEVVGALSNDAITEDDLKAGRFDDADVVIWLVNWNSIEERTVRFRGTFGEVQIAHGEFQIELRGLTDPLNRPKGDVYQPSCPAVLGDRRCKVDLKDPAFSVETIIKGRGAAGQYFIPEQSGFAEQWFDWGMIEVTSGTAKGLRTTVRLDRTKNGQRLIEVLTDFDIPPEVGDGVTIFAGCDKTVRTCREKFANFLNFRGFPHIPGNDWMASTPSSGKLNDGGSRYK